MYFKCPENCSKQAGSVVYGTEIYSEDSNLCLAAIHSGKLTDVGGDIEVLSGGEYTGFKASV